MKILVTGANGQLGLSLREVLEKCIPGSTVYTDRDTLDITDREAVMKYITDGQFTHIVNCAAYTAVENAESNPRECKAINADAVGYLAEAARANDVRIIHISTDYVFDGRVNIPYLESARVNPLQEYGRSKRRGEMLLLDFAPDGIILRTAWLYSEHGSNFVKKMYDLARTGKKAKVVTDQFGTPTYALDLARAIARILTSSRWIGGIFHYTDMGAASWYDLAAEVFIHCGRKSSDVTPALTGEYPSVATRPVFSILEKKLISSTYNVELPYWRESLQECLHRLDTREV